MTSLPDEKRNRSRKLGVTHGLVALLTLGSGCARDSLEAAHVQLSVVVDGSAVQNVTTDLGYQVELSVARLALADLQFTVAGEVHGSALQRLARELLLSTAHAHPGHYEGGEVTGELEGAYVVDWLAGDGVELGLATLLVGDYQAIYFTFARASKDEVDAQDPLLGHSALLEGTAKRSGQSYRFRALLDSPEDRQLVGLPFQEKVRETTRSAVGLQLVPRDPYEGDTLFDGLDFAALPTDDDNVIAIRPDAKDDALSAAYDLLRRTFQTHDHFDAIPLGRP